MAGSIAKAYVQIIPSAEGIKSNLSNLFNSEMPSAGKSAGGIFGSGMVSAIKGAIAAAGIEKMLSESLQAGAAKEQSLGGIETLFKDSANIVIANAQQAYKTAGMSANSYMETVTGFSASLLQGLSGDTRKAASVADMALTDMSDNANKMGTSMELIQNAYQGFAKQNYTMLDNLKLGYGGTKTEMERLLADASELAGVEYNIDNLADVYEAIHTIQKEMGVMDATAMEAETTISGSTASMKAAFQDVLANLALGENLEASLAALTETTFIFLTGNLMPAIGNVLQGIPTMLSTAFSMAIQGLNLAADNADALLQDGVELVLGIGSAIISAAPYLAEAALKIVASLGNAIITTNWGRVARDTIGDLGGSLDLAAAEILGSDDGIVEAILTAITTNLPSILEGGVGIVVELANGILQALPDFLVAAGELMKQLLSTILSMLPSMLSSGVSLAGQLAVGLVNNLPAVISSGATILADLLATIASHLPEMLEQGISLIGQLAAGLIAAIPDAVAAIPQIISNITTGFTSHNWASIGSNIIGGIANGIRSGVSSIINAAWSAAKSALSAAKNALQIKSPSRLMEKEVGYQIPAGIAGGIEKNTKPITAAMHDLSDVTVDSFAADLRLSAVNVPAAASAKSGGVTSIVINVYAAVGQNVDELVDELMSRLRFEVAKREAGLT